jgi:RNA polymerase sigma-70 factor (ECF subfamily)
MLEDNPLRLLNLTDTLSDILKDCLNGDRSAKEKLYRMFSSKMFGVCLRYCSNYDEAKDILQDGFIKVFENIKQFGNKGSFEGWVRRIIVNTALERFRKEKHHVVEKFPELHDVEEDGLDMDISIEEMMTLIQKLPDQYKMVFNLYVFEDMSHKEIAQQLGIAEGTSKSDLSRARSILQQKIKDKIQRIAKTGS